MDLATILKALEAIGPVLAAVPEVAAVIRSAGTLLSTNDQSELQSLLADLAADNDAGHARLQAKLAALAS